jgi:hypothetical protein
MRIRDPQMRQLKPRPLPLLLPLLLLSPLFSRQRQRPFR